MDDEPTMVEEIARIMYQVIVADYIEEKYDIPNPYREAYKLKKAFDSKLSEERP